MKVRMDDSHDDMKFSLDVGPPGILACNAETLHAHVQVLLWGTTLLLIHVVASSSSVQHGEPVALTLSSYANQLYLYVKTRWCRCLCLFILVVLL